jgi:hypothetical protein
VHKPEVQCNLRLVTTPLAASYLRVTDHGESPAELGRIVACGMRVTEGTALRIVLLARRTTGRLQPPRAGRRRAIHVRCRPTPGAPRHFKFSAARASAVPLPVAVDAPVGSLLAPDKPDVRRALGRPSGQAAASAHGALPVVLCVRNVL